MLHKVMDDLRGDAIVARDGSIGSLKDVYFDDERWGVRYLVIDTGGWLPGRKVLISPASIERDPADDKAIHVALTREQVQACPGAETDLPVSRQFEEAHARYYGYNYYWTGPYLWGACPLPGSAGERADTQAFREMKAAERRAEQSHLRSTGAVVGHHIQAADGPAGHVEDFVVNDDDWSIAGLVVDTRDWLPGRKVLVAPAVVRDIDWTRKKVFLRLLRDEVKSAQAAL